MGIVSAWAAAMQLGPIAGPIVAGVLTAALITSAAIQQSNIKKQRDAIKNTTLKSSSSGSVGSAPSGTRIISEQAAEGRYDVIGEDDNRLYKGVKYIQKFRTGIVNAPILAGERGSEMIIDHPTLQRLQTNAPEVIPTIMRHRVKQFAEGNLDSFAGMGVAGSGGSGGTYADFIEMHATLKDVRNYLAYLSKNPLYANVVLSELEAKQELLSKSFRRGSGVNS